MKIISLHVDHIRFKPLKKALKSIGELSEKEKKGEEVKEALVILSAVEKTDSDVKGVATKLVEEVKKIAEQVKTDSVVLYPYAHLSSNLSSPDLAVEVLKKAESELKKYFKKVVRAPFGYYKEFEMKVKGHPLSELSREIRVESKGEAEEIEEKVDIKQLLAKMSKVKMSAPRGKNGLKSNIELGRDLDLYIVNEVVGHGLPLFTPKGATILREMERFIIDEELKRGYLHTKTPIMAKADLYKVSGHWQHYKKDMFTLKIGGEDYALRPMTCPFQFVLYKRKPRSYKDLPVKYAETALLARNEKSGELRGLSRVRHFTLADAHIICTPKQLEEEFGKVLDLVKFGMDKIGINNVWYRFSKWDPKNKDKYIDNPKAWNDSQKMMKKILDKLKVKYIEADDEAAFYGPKLDVQYKDVYGKEDTAFTIQIDFALPERYDLTYKDKDNKDKRPMVIHRSSIGALERVMAHILEITQGNLKLWLSPIQVKVLSMTDGNNDYAEQIFDVLELAGIRTEIDLSNESMGKKVRNAQLQKVNYMITVGNKEQEKGKIAVRNRDGKVEFDIDLKEFVAELQKEIKNRE